jgi:hypothetical protein
MSILSSIRDFIFGKPVPEAKPEAPQVAPVVEVPQQPEAPVVEAAAPAKKPRAPRKPKADNWLQADNTAKRPAKIRATTKKTK